MRNPECDDLSTADFVDKIVAKYQQYTTAFKAWRRRIRNRIMSHWLVRQLFVPPRRSLIDSKVIPAFEISVQELIDEYITNQLRAETEFEGKLGLFKGTVIANMREPGGTPLISLTGNPNMAEWTANEPMVVCKLNNQDVPHVIEFSSGEQVLVRGEVYGSTSQVVFIDLKGEWGGAYRLRKIRRLSKVN